jgi:hypothetical protein
VAHTFNGQSSSDNPNLPLVLRRNERAFFTLRGAGLVESRRGAGHYVGGYSGFSFRIAKGVRYHVGTREWAFAKLLGYQHFDAPPWTAIQVSNRQKTSGVLCDAATAGNFQFRLALALAHFRGEVPSFVSQLEAQVRNHAASRPTEPSLPARRGNTSV